MYTLDMNKKRIKKTILVYLILSVFSIVVDNVYALFGHGVRSAAMSLMFLYPLIGGALVYFILYLAILRICSARWYRLGYNLYNAGIAALTVGSFFKGILDIAGTESGYSRMFAILGWGMAAAGILIFIISINDMRKVFKDGSEKDFIDELRCRNGNLNITLVLNAAVNEMAGGAL